VTIAERQTGFAVDRWSGELRSDAAERGYRDWAFTDDLRLFRATVLGIAALYVSFFIVDLAAVGLGSSFYWAAGDRAAVLLASIVCFRRLRTARDPATMDRIAIVFAVAVELGSFIIFGIIEQGRRSYGATSFCCSRRWSWYQVPTSCCQTAFG